MTPSASLIAGIDEVGRGPLAGAVVAAAVILPETGIPGVTDSKRLTPRRRETLAYRIRQEALAWSLGRAEVEEIDRLNIRQATFLAMRRALEGLSPGPHSVLVDGRDEPSLGVPVTAMVGGDGLVAVIGAASIVAKVARDAELAEMDSRYPGYGFARHKGYGTREHLDALRRLGPCALHRRSFRPVREAAEGIPGPLAGPTDRTGR